MPEFTCGRVRQERAQRGINGSPVRCNDTLAPRRAQTCPPPAPYIGDEGVVAIRVSEGPCLPVDRVAPQVQPQAHAGKPIGPNERQGVRRHATPARLPGHRTARDTWTSINVWRQLVAGARRRRTKLDDRRQAPRESRLAPCSDLQCVAGGERISRARQLERNEKCETERHTHEDGCGLTPEFSCG